MSEIVWYEFILMFAGFYLAFTFVVIVALTFLLLIWNYLIIKPLSIFFPNQKKLIVEMMPYDDLYNPYMPWVYLASAITVIVFLIYEFNF